MQAEEPGGEAEVSLCALRLEVAATSPGLRGLWSQSEPSALEPLSGGTP